MNQAPTKSHFKLNGRGLTELVLACLFLSLFTFALWSWQNDGYVAAMDNTISEAEVPLLPLILRHPAIILSTVVTEFILLLALTLAIVPISWWLRTDYLVTGANTRLMTPLRWLGEKLHLVRTPEQTVEGDYVVNEAGELVFVPVTGVDAEQEPETVMVEQADGTLLEMVKQPDGTMVPAESKPKEGEAASADAPLPIPEQQASDVLNFEENPEEEDPLADLADINDILNSAFDEDSAIDPEREAMSRNLEHVDMMDLLMDARNVLATFKQ
jgi:hypothetical protein